MSVCRANKVDRSTPFTYAETSTPKTCPMCHTALVFGLQTIARLDDMIVHDYCIRTKLGK